MSRVGRLSFEHWNGLQWAELGNGHCPMAGRIESRRPESARRVVSTGHRGSGEVGLAEIGSADICPIQYGSTEIGPAQRGAGKIGIPKVVVPQVCTEQAPKFKIRIMEH